jgi:hypothetical protein
MKLTKLLNSSAAAVLSGVLALGQMGAAQADDAAPGQQQQAQPVSAQQGELNSAQMRDMANDYSKDNGIRVGIFLNIAPDTRLTPQQLGAAMVSKFAKQGVEASYIFNYAKAGVSTTTYYVGGLGVGPYDFGRAAEGFNEVMKVYRGLKTEQQLSGTPPVEENLALNN